MYYIAEMKLNGKKCKVYFDNYDGEIKKAYIDGKVLVGWLDDEFEEIFKEGNFFEFLKNNNNYEIMSIECDCEQ